MCVFVCDTGNSLMGQPVPQLDCCAPSVCVCVCVLQEGVFGKNVVLQGEEFMQTTNHGSVRIHTCRLFDVLT